MLIEKEKIIQAKEKIADIMPDLIAELLQVEKYDAKNKKGCCPFHGEDTPSLIWNKKMLNFKCFGCGRNVDILDAYMHTGLSYGQSVQKLFDLAAIKYPFGELGVKQDRAYKYPKLEDVGSKDRVYAYLADRGISKQTIDNTGITEDSEGNICFNYYDTSDVLTMVKKRPSRKVKHGETKNWCQQGSDTMPLLFNMNRVNTSAPLLITEGECMKGDAEVLTPNGWVRLDKYKGEQVLQVDQNLQGSFVTPIAYVNHDYDGLMFKQKGRNCSYEVTANHNVVYCDNKGKINKKRACELPRNLYGGYIPCTASVNGEGIPLTLEQIALYLAVSADCTIDIRKKTHSRYSRFSVSKERKFVRMQCLLKACGIDYFCNEIPDKNGHKYIGFKTPEFIKSKMLPYEWIYQATLEQRLFIIEEMVHWDGNRVKTRHQYEYSSKEIHNANFMQAIAHTCGYMSSIIRRQNDHGKWYKVSVLLRKKSFSHTKGFDKEHYSGKVYCVTVPTGMIMVRQNEKIFITGNCDTLAAIEAGYTNAVSIPLGAGNTHWIETNWDFLEQFESVIICFDNDAAGVKARKEVVPRLGAWRTKYIEIPPTVVNSRNGKTANVKDLNEVLYYGGTSEVMRLIDSAEDPGVPSVANVSDIQDVDLDEMDGVETGIKELDAELMKLFYGTLTIVSGKPGCVDKETEFFNGTQWKKISEYQPGDKVLQYSADGTSSLVYPIKYHKYPCNTFYHLKTQKGMDQMLSPDHNVVYITSKGNLKKKLMQDVYVQHSCSESGFHGKFIPSFEYHGTGVDISDSMIRVMCAVIADGTFKSNLPEKSKQYNTVRINLKKARKKQRLHELLQESNTPYGVHSWNPSDKEFESFVFDVPVRTKKFPDEWYNFNEHQKQVFLDECLFWDGSIDKKGRRQFHTTDKHNADFVQFMFASSGYKTTISCIDRVGRLHSDGIHTYKSLEYSVIITQKKHTRLSLHNSKEKIEIKAYDNLTNEYEYCFTVPSGMLVLRRNNCICVTGNCGKSSFLSQLMCQSLEQDKPVWMFSREMPGWMARNWLNYILSGSHHVKEYEQSNGAKYYKIDPQSKAEISKYYDKRWFLYRDDWSNKLDDVMVSMEDSVRKYGVKLLIVDNLMTLDLEQNENSELLKQTECIERLIKFAMKYSVAVVLVAHPKKMAEEEDIGIYSISGSSNISNLSHRTIGLRRINKEKEKSAHDVCLTIIKDRMMGRAGKKIDLYYDVPTRRFYTNEDEYNYQYGWDKGVYSSLPYPHEEEKEVYGEI